MTRLGMAYRGGGGAVKGLLALDVEVCAIWSLQLNIEGGFTKMLVDVWTLMHDQGLAGSGVVKVLVDKLSFHVSVNVAPLSTASNRVRRWQPLRCRRKLVYF